MNLGPGIRRLLSFCWYSAATLIVLFALLVAAVRTLLPELDSIRDELTAQLSAQSGLDLEFGRLGASWKPKGPQLVIDHFRLPAQEDLELEIKVEQAVAQLDFWASLLDLDLRFDEVSFTGVEVRLLGALTPGSGEGSGNALDAFKRTFLHGLRRLTLDDARLFLPLSEQRGEPVHIAHLQWRNQGNRHLGEGRLYLDSDSNQDETLRLAVELRSDRDQLFGRSYVQAEQLDIGDWLARQIGSDGRQYSGVLNMESWISFDEYGLRSGQVEFGESDFSWQGPEPQRMAIKGGRLVWSPSEGGGLLASQDLQLQSNGAPWPQTHFALRHRQGDLSLWLDGLQLDKLKPLLGLIPGINNRTLSDMLAANGRGEIRQIRAQRHQGTWALAADLESLGWDMSGKVPGVAGVNGRFTWVGEQGRLHLPSQKAALYWPWQFSHTVQFSELSGDLAIRNQDGWVVTTDNLRLDGAVLQADLAAALRLPGDRPVRLQLYGNARVKQMEEADRLFPRKAMGEGLSGYLAEALQAGHTDNAQVLWHGDLADYPYEGGQGVFQAAFTMEQGQFQFLPSWPAVTDITLDALFENMRMDLWVRQGLLERVPVENAHVFIPTLNRSATLTVTASVRTDAAAASELMAHSSLASSVGTTLKELQIGGAVATSLDLTFPLGSAVSDQPPSILGRVALWDNPVHLRALSTDLTDVRGELSFDSGRVSAEGLTASVFNQPLTLDVDTGPEGDVYRARVDLSGRWHTDNLPKGQTFPLFQHLEGEAQWQGQLQMNFRQDGDYAYQAKVETSLEGLEVDLPAPVGKSASTPVRTVLEVNGDQSGAQLLASQGMRIGYLAEFDIDSLGFHWPRYQLAIGRRPGLIGVDSGSIELAISRVKLEEWLPLITAFVTTTGDGSHGAVPPLTRVHGSLSRLDIFGLHFDQTLLEGWPDEQGWRFRAESDQMRGELLIGRDWQENGIRVDADRLQLEWDSQSGPRQPESASLIAQMPAVEANVANFHVRELDLGQLTLSGRHDPQGYRVDELRLTRPEYQFKATGLWQPQGEKTRFDIRGQLASPDFGKMSAVIGQPLGLEESSLDAAFNVGWQDAPWALEIPSLDGDLEFAFGKGSLSQVSDKGARILSLFSLDSLLRKLSLDFTDVFGKGFYYQSFDGTVQFADGVASTSDTKLDGDAGVMKIRGSSNLVSRELDYRISFSPALTASVPAVALMSGASLTVGVGAFAVSKILEPVIEVITQLNYKLTGTFDDPVLEELERDKREIRIIEEAQPESEPQAEPRSPTPDYMESLPEPLPEGEGRAVGQ
ncbi:TIGR02099 family protein [Ferrimonas sediminicola]|uniref:TIGR02099 family protein n=1 Tax=Ferrimonas sediminicola TaxID=2569538 RepID=A0A4U1BIE5_9GAMM|nr:YhdP family protein [Ferrimonas sediminicola]TKB51220.1 TIGR02099 family protein [Ferrimonas sediminicola]